MFGICFMPEIQDAEPSIFKTHAAIMWTLPALYPQNLCMFFFICVSNYPCSVHPFFELHKGKKAFTHSTTSVEQIVYLIATAERKKKNLSLLEMGTKAGFEF